MSISLERLASREKGPQVPISIGSALAIESACGMPTPEGEPRIKPGAPLPINQYEALWVNLRTLFRNCLGSLPRDARNLVQPEDLTTALHEEMQVIESTITKVTQGRVMVVFYFCNFISLKRKYPRALLKEARTDLQKTEVFLEQKSILPFLEDDHGLDIRKFDLTIDAGGPNTLMLTHLPIDLLSKPHFKSLTLLESHTGAMKRQSEWTTKLTGKNLARIPFCRFALQLFGDGTMFNTMNIKLKEEILRIATEDRWTTLTTTDKMRYSINKIYDPRVKTFFLSLL